MVQVDEKEATHVAIPVALFQAMSALIAEKINWGIADQIMTPLKTQAVLVKLGEKSEVTNIFRPSEEN